MQNIRASSDSIGPLRRESLHRYSFHCNVSSLWQYQPCSKTLMYKCHFQTGNQEKQNIGASFIMNSCHFIEMTQELCRAVLSLFQLWRGSFKKELVIIPPYIFPINGMCHSCLFSSVAANIFCPFVGRGMTLLSIFRWELTTSV